MSTGLHMKVILLTLFGFPHWSHVVCLYVYMYIYIYAYDVSLSLSRYDTSISYIIRVPGPDWQSPKEPCFTHGGTHVLNDGFYASWSYNGGQKWLRAVSSFLDCVLDVQQQFWQLKAFNFDNFQRYWAMGKGTQRDLESTFPNCAARVDLGMFPEQKRLSVVVQHDSSLCIMSGVWP